MDKAHIKKKNSLGSSISFRILRGPEIKLLENRYLREYLSFLSALKCKGSLLIKQFRSHITFGGQGQGLRIINQSLGSAQDGGAVPGPDS